MASLKLPVQPRKAENDLLGFDIGDDLIKIAHIKVSSLRREVQNLLSGEIRGLTDDEISALIKDALGRLGLGRARAYLMVPLQAVITRSIEIPSLDPEEIREIVNLQASRHTPYSRAEIIIDTLTVGTVRDSYTKVLLVIVPKDIVARQTRILEKAGLKPEKVFFPPEALTQAFSKILQNESSDRVTVVVHMDATFTAFMVIQRSKLLFMRGISVGADQLLQERDVYADRFTDELQKSLESYTSDEAGPLPAEMILTGAVAENTDLDDLFAEALSIPIRHQTYFQTFSITDRAKQVAETSKRISFFSVIAPVLLFDRLKADLVTEERKLRMHLERRARDIMTTAVLSLILLILVFSLFVEKLYFRTQYLEKLQARYRPVREDARSLEQIFAKTQLIKGYLLNRGMSIETLSELYDALPMEVRIASVKYENGKNFTAKGTSRTMSAAFSFVSNLEKSKRFQNVKTKYVTTRSEDGQDVADFEITALIENEDRK